MNTIKYQTLVIKQVGPSGGRAAGTMENYTITLDSNYSRCTGVEFIEETNSDNNEYELQLSNESETLIDYATRLHYLAIKAGSSMITGDFASRFHNLMFEAANKKATVGVRNTDTLASTKIISLKIIFRLEK